jgi:hypothetical protein
MAWLLMEEAMSQPSPDEIACALADALPRNAERRSELIAIGMLATALIAGSRTDDRADLVELFCSQLRKSVANELN